MVHWRRLAMTQRDVVAAVEGMVSGWLEARDWGGLDVPPKRTTATTIMIIATRPPVERLKEEPEEWPEAPPSVSMSWELEEEP